MPTSVCAGLAPLAGSVVKAVAEVRGGVHGEARFGQPGDCARAAPAACRRAAAARSITESTYACEWL